MSKTSDKILNTSLKLFNKYGLAKVTLRTIANEMGISQGNLNYHFKKREEIIEALYFRLVANIDKGIVKVETEKVGLSMLFNSSKVIMHNFYTYRFSMLDFVQIMRENKKIKNHYIQLTTFRQEQFVALFQLMVSNGIMKKPTLPNEYLNLYNRFQILGDFWISSATVTHKKITKKTIIAYSEILNQAIYPYLTKKGKKEYNLIIKNSQ